MSTVYDDALVALTTQYGPPRYDSGYDGDDEVDAFRTAEWRFSTTVGERVDLDVTESNGRTELFVMTYGVTQAPDDGCALWTIDGVPADASGPAATLDEARAAAGAWLREHDVVMATDGATP